MLLNLLSLGALVFLAFIFFTLFLRSVHSHYLAARLLGGLFSGLLTLVFVVALAAALFGLWRTSVPRVRPLPDVKVASTPELVSRDRDVAQSCIPCHSFDGGADGADVDDPVGGSVDLYRRACAEIDASLWGLKAFMLDLHV